MKKRISIKKKIAVFILVISLCVALFNSIICNEKPIAAKINNNWSFPALNEMGVDLGLANPETNINEQDYALASAVVFPPVRYSFDLVNRAGNPYARPLTQGVNGVHVFGTDRLGRDVFAGTVRGFYIAFKVAFLSLLFAALIGVFLGIFMGYYGDNGLRWNLLEYAIVFIGLFMAIFYLIYPISQSWIGVLGLIIVLLCGFYGIKQLFARLPLKKFIVPFDFFWNKVIEVFKSLPALIVLLAALPLFSSRGSFNIIIILILLSWKGFARHSRAETYSIKEKEYVVNAKAQGQSDFLIMLKQVLPNILPTILVFSSFVFVSLILVESSLSFLGFGLPLGEVSWGSLLSEGRFNASAWWLSVFPGLCIFVIILSINLLVDKKISLDE